MATTPDEKLELMLAGYQTSLMAGGHTHEPILRRHQDKLLVNPGSVGMPFIKQAALNSDMPHAQWWAQDWRQS